MALASLIFFLREFPKTVTVILLKMYVDKHTYIYMPAVSGLKMFIIGVCVVFLIKLPSYFASFL